MTKLPADFIAQQRQRLLERRRDLMDDLRSFAHEDPSIPGDWETSFPVIGEDEDENAQEITAYINELPVEFALEEELQKVNAALQNVQNGTYGICRNCNQLIARERLEIYPEAKDCLSCTEKST